MQLLDTVSKNLKDLVNSIEVKMPYYGKKYDTLEIMRNADIYYSASTGTDSFNLYKTLYSEAVYAGFISIGITLTDYQLSVYSANPTQIKIDLVNVFHKTDIEITLCINVITATQRELYVERYEEKNNYYRKLIGLPPIETSVINYIRITEKEYAENSIHIDIGDEYQISRDTLRAALVGASEADKALIAKKFAINNNSRFKEETVKINNVEYRYLVVSTVDSEIFRVSDFTYNATTKKINIGGSVEIDVYNPETDTFASNKAFPIKYIHNEKNIDKLYVLEIKGIINKYKTIFPSYTYLNYISSSSKIDLNMARRSQPFSILRINKQLVPYAFLNKFITIYNQCREYFTITIYNNDLAYEYYLYDNFIGLSIMVMTIQRVLADSFRSGIQRDFYDWDFIQKIYTMYNIPFIGELSMENHVIILKNLNNLLRYKSTDKVLYDLIDILGYNEVLDVTRYFLVRDHNFDENERPRFFYKRKDVETLTGTERDFVYDEYGNPVIDYDKTFSVYFQGISMKETNSLLSLNNNAKKYSYSEITGDDPYWIEDEDLINVKNGIGVDPKWIKKKELYSESDYTDKKTYDAAYNYIESKYIGLDSMYDMTELYFEFMYYYGVLLNKKTELDAISTLHITLPKITVSDTYFSLVDTIIFLMASMLKLRNLDIDKCPIPTKPTQVSATYKFDFTKDNLEKITDLLRHKSNATTTNELYKYQTKSIVTGNEIMTSGANKSISDVESGSYGFNFNSANMIYNLIKDDDSLDQEFKDYFKPDSAGKSLQIKTKDDINKLFNTLKYYRDYMITHMNSATSKSEYNLYKTIYRISMVSEIQSSIYGEDTTYGSYLKNKLPVLYNVLEVAQYSQLTSIIEHTYSQIEKVIGDVFEYNFATTSQLSPVLKAIIALVNFFKSYTTDLTSFNIIYLFGSKYENRIRMYDNIEKVVESTDYNDTINGLYFDDVTISTNLCTNDRVFPKFYQGTRMDLTDTYIIHETQTETFVETSGHTKIYGYTPPTKNT